MKIVLTGGPSAGKTTIAEVLTRTYSSSLALVPESAAILFQGGFPRAQSTPEMRHQQVAIYHVQKQCEAIVQLQNPKKGLICDRGSLDGLAYWGKPQNDFFKKLDTNVSKEIQRYDWVIHLDTADLDNYQLSSIRRENYQLAFKMNAVIKKVWSAHPQQIILNSSKNFNEKINKVIDIVGRILEGSDFKFIQQIAKGK